MKNIKNHHLYKVWNRVPVTYYQKGIRNNFFQYFWHTQKIKLAKCILSSLKFNNCLDVGCASGYMISQIASIFPNVKYFGIDIYDKAIKYAKKTYPNVVLISLVEPVCLTGKILFLLQLKEEL